MILEGLDPIVLLKLISQQVEQVTCLECCKYYIAPETATCGHTLCHACWSGRHSCPTCAAPFDRKALRLNLPLKNLTEHVHVLGDTFEKLFNVKIDEFEFNIPEKIQVSDPTKNVKDWLASSQNHFSAPVLSSQQSTQDVLPAIELSSSKLQIHSKTKKTHSPIKVVLTPQPQEDWDKIEVLPDTEEFNPKNKENLVEPINLEPFSIDDNEYTNDNPRRSFRKREINPDGTLRKRNISCDKVSKNSSTDTEKHLLKTKQNWNSVKKMRKEFGKLNKKNKSKLNVSIEMCKKAQSKSKRQPPTSPDTSKQPVYNIHDGTPDITKEMTPKNTITASFKENVNTDFVTYNKNTIDEPSKEENTDKTSKSENKSHELIGMDVDENQHKIPQKSITESMVGNELPFSNSVVNKSNSETNVTNSAKMPLIEKTYSRQPSPDDNCVVITQNEVNTNPISTNTDDIEISIKIGSTITNIVIKKKQHDMRVKLNTDREIQTCLGPYGLISKNDVACSPIKTVSVQNIELNVADGNIVEVNKSTISTKKNTASADTATAQFEITDSVERELSNVMESIVPGTYKKNQKTPIKQTTTNVKSQVNETNGKSQVNETKLIEIENEIPEDMEGLDDLDLFNSGSVKETDVKLLKNSKPALSEILVISSNTKKYKPSDKRDRDVDVDDDIDDMPQNKKQKIGTNSHDSQKPNEQPANPIDLRLEIRSPSQVQDSENMNYDAIMGQVFANIDADIKSSQKKVTTKDIPTENTTKQTNLNNSKANAQLSQIIHKTPVSQRKSYSLFKVKNASVTEDIVNEKYSENMFSMLDKDSEPQEVTARNNQHPVTEATQQRIDNLLTPGMRRELIATREQNTHTDHIDLDLLEQDLGTPVVQHDEDVVEETPQKNVSFLNSKQKSDSSNKVFTKPFDKNPGTQKLSQIAIQMTDSQIIKSIINISDSAEEPTKSKDGTVIENPKQTLETPLTINKFVTHIKHNSTPVARKSLNFQSEDPEQTLCPTTTQEKELMEKAFEQTQNTPKRPLTLKNVRNANDRKFCVAGSCLTLGELANVKRLCLEQGWKFVDKYTDELTHLVVGVDEDNISQRSVKYMCALAASKFIVSYEWVDKCLMSKAFVSESPYEALDSCGEPGPRRSRIAEKKLFNGFTFYCMSPFSILDVGTLKQILESAGGQVVTNVGDVTIGKNDTTPKILLAEPENTQEDRFIYVAMEFQVVPVNYEWALNCLGAYRLCSIHELLLCPMSLLPRSTSLWPSSLLEREEIE